MNSKRKADEQGLQLMLSFIIILIIGDIVRCGSAVKYVYGESEQKALLLLI